jgi:acetyltransferase-like isoleucine patch superfamily enzyme
VGAGTVVSSSIPSGAIAAAASARAVREIDEDQPDPLVALAPTREIQPLACPSGV